ncbi:MAG: LptF/LptG family permease, partial [Acetobacteraceae bacterium]
LSTGLSTLLLALLGIPLGQVKPRQGKQEKFGVAVLVYAGYYLLVAAARTWVERGAVPAFPGLWWAPALLALVVLAASAGPGLRRRRRGGWE